MSDRLRKLRERVDANQRVKTDEARVAWLNRASFETDGLLGPDEWIETLNAISQRLASRARISIVSAWFRAAGELAESVPDPQDRLYGITLSVHARNVGLRYEDARTFAELFQRYAELWEQMDRVQTDDPAEEACQFYEFVTNQLLNVETALEHPLDNDEVVDCEMLADPSVVVNAAYVFYCLLDALRQEADEDGGEVDEDLVSDCIVRGGHFLWAAFHAKRCGVDTEELASFVVSFDDWFVMMDELVGRQALAPDVLAAMRDCEAGNDMLSEDGPELVAMWRNEGLASILPLTEYLTQTLTAVEQNA